MLRHLWDREAWSLDPYMLHTIVKGLRKCGVPGLRIILDKVWPRGLRIRESYAELEADPWAVIRIPGSTEYVCVLVFGTNVGAGAITDIVQSQVLSAVHYQHELNISHLRPPWRQQQNAKTR
ncbi:hypothetical protein [Noviherbaspirillum aridicola]|nr:hypothetical protein [Noviherbaspirillum aridicola]